MSDQTCTLKSNDHCTGKDLREIHPARPGLPRTFYSFTSIYCRGCRELMNGAWKYPRKKK